MLAHAAHAAMRGLLRLMSRAMGRLLLCLRRMYVSMRVGFRGLLALGLFALRSSLRLRIAPLLMLLRMGLLALVSLVRSPLVLGPMLRRRMPAASVAA